MVLPGRDVPLKDFFKALKKEVVCDDVTEVAGAVTFFGVLALFPFLLFLVALASLIIDPADAAKLIDELNRIAPPQVAEIVGDRIRKLGEDQSTALLTFGALGAVWAASGGVTSLITALNTAYDVTESRSWFKVRLLAIATTLAVAALSIAAAAIAVATPAVADWIGGPIGTLILWLRIPVAALLMMLVLALLYYFLPDVEQEFKFITPGAVLAVVLWVIASLLFSLYVNNFGSYEVSYGALGGVIVLLLWMWISSTVVLLGAEINALLEHMSPEGKRVGARKMSDKGADAPKTEKKEAEGVDALVDPRRAKPAPLGFSGMLAAVGLGFLLGRRKAR